MPKHIAHRLLGVLAEKAATLSLALIYLHSRQQSTATSSALPRMHVPSSSCIPYMP